jgi:thiamine-monophosphate kinase
MRENALLAQIYAANRSLPSSVVIPPGDDMGAVRLGGELVLMKVDQVAEGVHFSPGTPLELIARKALTRNLSDVAAMASLPVAAVCAACLPRNFGEERAHQLGESMRRIAADYGCPLIGGDISMWDQPLIITVTLIAEPAGVEPVLRSGAKPGDVICVTGKLGGSWAPGSDVHLTFEPRIELARTLAKTVKLHSMMDISDGLAMDLPRLCEASGVAAEVAVDRLPLRDEAIAWAKQDGKSAWRHGLNDGEDYELLFTVGEQDAARLPREIDGVPITPIGRIIAGERPVVTLLHGDGRRELMGDGGWEHRG